MRLLTSGCLFLALIVLNLRGSVPSQALTKSGQSSGSIAGFRNADSENATESKFLAVPDASLARQHLKTLTQAPHIAGSAEDKATADYVAARFREAGLETEIVE